MSELTTLTKEQETRVKAWQSFALTLDKTETTLKLMADKATKKLFLPEKIEDVPKAEASLAEVKKDFKEIEKKRKELTAHLDRVTSRLMESEKLADSVIKPAIDKIIEIKKAYELEQSKIEAKNNELKNLKERLNIKRIEIIDGFKTKVNEFISNCFIKALDQNTSPEMIGSVLLVNERQLIPSDFIIPIPEKLPPTNYVTKDELTELVNQILVHDVDAFVKNARAELRFKFSDYDSAFANKKEAIAQNEREQQEKQKEQIQQKANEVLSVEIEAQATPLNFEPTVAVSSLKKIMKIDMPETTVSMVAIWKAYFANFDLVDSKMRISKKFKMCAENIIIALEAVKKDDPKFNPAGIIWKETEKI